MAVIFARKKSTVDGRRTIFATSESRKSLLIMPSEAKILSEAKNTRTRFARADA